MSGRMLLPIRAAAKGSSDPWNGDKMPGISLSQGQLWKEQRRFMVRKLTMAFKEESSQNMIRDDINEFLSHLEAYESKPVEIFLQFELLSAKILLKLCTGGGCQFKEQNDLRDLRKSIGLVKSIVGKRSQTFDKFISAHPSLAAFLKWFLPLNTDSILKDVNRFIEQNIENRKNTPGSYVSSQSFIESYLEKIEEQNIAKQELSFVGSNGNINLHNVVHEITFVGSSTFSNTFKCVLVLMMQNPDVQEKVYQELATNIGVGMKPSIFDRIKTPYTQAVLTEVYRVICVADKGLPHRAMSDCHLSTGHYIPKDTMLILWYGEVMRDPQIFPKPDMFDPSRFLDNNGLFAPHPKVIRFGLGQRRCAGEIIGHDLVYLLFTGIMSQFRLQSDKDDKQLTHFDPTNLQPFQVKFVSR